jgi:hypothetical protein
MATARCHGETFFDRMNRMERMRTGGGGGVGVGGRVQGFVADSVQCWRAFAAASGVVQLPSPPNRKDELHESLTSMET